MKYISFKKERGSIESAVVFNNAISHSEIGDLLKYADFELLGAGFVKNPNSDDAYCYGFSESIELTSRERDTKIIKMMMMN